MSRSLIAYTFGVLAIILIFLFSTLGTPDPVNPYFHVNNSLLRIFFYSSAIVAIATVAYFGYQPVGVKLKLDQRSKAIFVTAGIALVGLYVFSFNPILAPNGDNAEYIINAKSIVEKGGIYRLDTKTETPNTLAAPGLPLMLVPIYAKWGLDFVKMKYLIMTMGILILPLLLVLFRLRLNLYASIFLALIGFSSPYLVANSTTIMTETPYLFWSLLVLIFTLKFSKSKYFSIGNYFCLLLFLTMAVSTRMVGFSLVLSVLGYLGLLVPWSKVFARRVISVQQRHYLIKFLAVLGLVLAISLLWLWNQPKSQTSPLKIFLSMGVGKHLQDNFISFFNVLADLVFSPGSFRWYRLSPEHNLPLFSLAWLPVYFLIFIGVYSDLKKKQLLGMYTLSMILLILIASFTPQERVTMRYVSVVIPLLIYHLYSGLIVVGRYVERTWSRRISRAEVKVFQSLIMLSLLAVHLNGNSYNVFTKSAVYNEWYESFLNAAKWCGENLPDDSFVMSIKPRIVYLYSGLKGTAMVNERDIFSAEYGERKLQEIRDKGVTHLIVDVISNSTKRNIYPILNANREKFRAIPISELNDKCTVVEVLDW